uniref:Uncharacterized protein n=1 Tax=Chelydra serpentina TaxID=8475 RepID=A0A8C3XUH4_CHESE
MQEDWTPHIESSGNAGRVIEVIRWKPLLGPICSIRNLCRSGRGERERKAAKRSAWEDWKGANQPPREDSEEPINTRNWHRRSQLRKTGKHF